MSDSDMTNSCSSCGSSSSCGGSDCSTCGGCSTDANQHSTITLTMEDDTEVECAILTIFPVGGNQYIALLPLNEDGENEDGEVFLYRYKDENGNPSLENIEDDGEVYLYSFTRTAEGAPMLSNIESDEEYNKAAIAFDTVLQNAREAEAAGTPLE